MVINSTKDKRAGVDEITTHSGCKTQAIKVDSLNGVITQCPVRYNSAKAIVIDEAQFFDGKELVSFVQISLDAGKDCIIAGLDSDANQKPWLPLEKLVVMATKFKKLSSFCQICKDGTEAGYTIDVAGGACKDNIRVGNDGYVTVCWMHMREHQNNTVLSS
jgi:thymidine kinase